MKMERKKFRIGELAQKVGVERFVIRFWEKEFSLSSDRSSGGQRFYSEEDLTTFLKIKQLLYKEGFTIPGAKKKLHAFQAGATATAALDEPQKELLAQKTDWDQEELLNHISTLKKQLRKLRELL